MALRVLSLVVLTFASLAVVNAVEGVLKKLNDYPEALCLDGSPGAYYHRFNKASPNWIIFHEGGGWCYDVAECASRSLGRLGTSKNWTESMFFEGMLSDVKSENEFLYDWNIVYIKYCDGSSFSGYRENPVKYQNYTLHYRGKSIKEAVLADVKKNFPLNQAKQVIISGCSAGGLSTYIHLDWYRENLASTIRVVGLPDAGWFLDEKTVAGVHQYAAEMAQGFAQWNSSSGVNQKCIKHYSNESDHWHCLFAQYIYPFLTTPIFILNARFDAWSLQNILREPCAKWQIKLTTTCNATQLAVVDSWGEKMQESLQQVNDSKNGMFVDACNFHCQIYENWNRTKIKNTPVMIAFNNWFTNSSSSKFDDNCNYGCNESCPEFQEKSLLAFHDYDF